jgi:hypothetical protein
MTRTRRPTIAILMLLVVASIAQAQSLAEVAKKAEDEHAKATSTDGKTSDAPKTRSYTDKDLKPAPSSEVKPPATDTATSAPDTKASKSDAADSTAKKPSKDEAYWRGRVAPLHQKVAETLAKLVVLDRRISDLTVDLQGIGPLNARRGGVESERQRLITESDSFHATVDADKAAIQAIEEEGRRAGALPGWFR